MLARTLGKTVSELSAAMTAEEFGEWQVLYMKEPWGEKAADLRSGIVASTIANVNRDPKKRKEPYRPSDFMRDDPWNVAADEIDPDPREFLSGK